MTIALGVHVTSGMTIQSLGLKITGAVTVHDGGIMTPRWAKSMASEGTYPLSSEAETDICYVSWGQLCIRISFGSGPTTGWLISLQLANQVSKLCGEDSLLTDNSFQTPGKNLVPIHMLWAWHRHKRWVLYQWLWSTTDHAFLNLSSFAPTVQPLLLWRLPCCCAYRQGEVKYEW